MMFFVTAVAGLAIFLFGIDLINAGLSKLFSERIKRFLDLSSKSIVWAVVIGGIVTVLIQNSNTPVVMLMGFATSRLVDLKGAMGIILGADIGSTLTVQLISFNLYDAGLVLIAAGFLIGVFIKDQRAKAASSFFTGLGFILFSMKLLTMVSSLASPHQLSVSRFLLHNPYVTFFSSLVLTSIIQSSAATIGLAISFANMGMLNLQSALPIILGANIGTCSTALFAMYRADVNGRRVAVIHLLFKVTGVVLVLLFYKPFLILSQMTAHSVAHQIANAHTFFNVFITLVLAPLASPLSRFLVKHIKIGREVQVPDTPLYLDESALSTPPIAFHYALKEIVRLADYIYGMLEVSYTSLSHNNLWNINELDARNIAVERLASKIKLYLAHLSGAKNLEEKDAARQFGLIRYLKNLEVISDIISENLSSEIVKKTTGQYRLSEEGWGEVRRYFRDVMQFYRDVLSAIEGGKVDSPAFAERKRLFSQTELLLLKHHLERLNKGYRESIETSAIHIELISTLRHIVSQLSYMVEPMGTV